MWQQLVTSFGVGLSVAPACVLHCGVFHLAFISRLGAGRRRAAATLGLLILGGRFSAYLLLGSLLGLVVTSGVWIPSPRLLNVVLMLVMAAYALVPRRRSCARSRLPASLVGGALGLGFVTGLAPCPPLLASGVIALQSRGVFAAMATFAAFFGGSSLLLLPLVFSQASLPESWRKRLGGASRAIAAVVAVYAGVTAVRGFRSLPPGSPRPLPAPRVAGVTERGAEKEIPDPPQASADIQPLYRKVRPKGLLTRGALQKLKLSLHEARHYDVLGNGSVQCGLCPRRCLLKEGERGLCRVRANIDGRLTSIVYARPVTVHADPVEKKPLFHVFPGSTALSLATVGCNSGCVFCQNYEISQAYPEDVRPMVLSPAKIVAVAKERGDAGIAYTYTEPTVFYEYMLDIARQAKAEGLRNYWITCGQINEKPLRELCQVLDAANVDLKGFSDEFYVRYCDFHLAPVLKTLRVLKEEGVFIEVTNLLIPDANDAPDMIRSMCRWLVQELGEETPLHFSRFHPDYKLTKRPPTPPETLEMARRIALEAGLKHVYIGNIRVDGGSDTLCPKCRESVIRRSGYLVLENTLVEGRCPSCAAPVGGLWTRTPHPERD